MGMTGLATPGNENRADETNPILGFQSGIREHEESMTYTIFSEEANRGSKWLSLVGGCWCGGWRDRPGGLSYWFLAA
jgi:hypothetical protein